jgi:hypothetical protein
VPSSSIWRDIIAGCDWAKLCRRAGVQQGQNKASKGNITIWLDSIGLVSLHYQGREIAHGSRECNVLLNFVTVGGLKAHLLSSTIKKLTP